MTITDYMSLVRYVQRNDVLNIIKKNRDKILEKSRLYRENNKDKIKQNRRNITTHEEHIQNLYNQINILT